jgi:hypothetical protein
LSSWIKVLRIQTADPAFHFDNDPDPDMTIWYGSRSGSLLFLSIHLKSIFLVSRSARFQTAGLCW